MKIIKNIYSAIGLVSEWSSKVASWLVIFLIVIIIYDVTMRHVFNSPTSWAFDLSYMLGAAFAAIGFAYVHYLKGNVRVDLIYNRWTPRGKLLIDIFFTIIFFFPFYFMLANLLVQDALYAYQFGETTFTSHWYPLTWPYKTLIALGFCLLFLQGIAIFLKDIVTLIKWGEDTW